MVEDGTSEDADWWEEVVNEVKIMEGEEGRDESYDVGKTPPLGRYPVLALHDCLKLYPVLW